jgi:hypothetical protein
MMVRVCIVYAVVILTPMHTQPTHICPHSHAHIYTLSHTHSHIPPPTRTHLHTLSFTHTHTHTHTGGMLDPRANPFSSENADVQVPWIINAGRFIDYQVCVCVCVGIFMCVLLICVCV